MAILLNGKKPCPNCGVRPCQDGFICCRECHEASVARAQDAIKAANRCRQPGCSRYATPFLGGFCQDHAQPISNAGRAAAGLDPLPNCDVCGAGPGSAHNWTCPNKAKRLTAKEIAKVGQVMRWNYNTLSPGERKILSPASVYNHGGGQHEPAPTCREHPGDYGPLCDACTADKAAYRAWKESKCAD